MRRMQSAAAAVHEDLSTNRPLSVKDKILSRLSRGPASMADLRDSTGPLLFAEALGKLVTTGRVRHRGTGADGTIYELVADPVLPAAEAGAAEAPVATPIDERSGRALTVPVVRIRASPLNPRKHFEEAKIAELAESIEERGLIEPLVVRGTVRWVVVEGKRNGREAWFIHDRARIRERPGPDGELYDMTGFSNAPLNGVLEHYESQDDAEAHVPHYELLAGERRWRACQVAGMETVPVMVRSGVDDRTALEIMLAENDDRQDLDAIERARAYQALQSVGYTQQEIAERIKRSQPVVANTIRLLQLPDDVQQMVSRGELSMTHGMALLKWSQWPELCASIAEASVELKATVKQLAEPGVPFSARIPDRLVKLIRGYECAFNYREVCPECPFGAFLPEGNLNYPYCLKPDHYQELQSAAEADASRRAAEEMEKFKAHTTGNLSEKTKEALATAGEGMDLTKLPFGSYVPFHPGYLRPTGCGDLCSCLASGTHRGDVIQACLDPGRHNALKAAETRERKKAARQEHEAVIEQLKARRNGQVDPAALAILAWTVLRSVSVECRRAPQLPPGLPPAAVDLFIKNSFETTDLKAWKALASIPPATLIGLAAECFVREEQKGILDEHAGKGESERAKFILSQPEPAAAETGADPDQNARLRLELRSVQSQLESAQALLRQGSSVIHHDTQVAALQASTQRAREEADAAKTEALALRTELKNLREDLKRSGEPRGTELIPGGHRPDLVAGMRVIVTGRTWTGTVGEVIRVSPARDFYLIRPDGTTACDEWLPVSDLAEALAPPRPEPSLQITIDDLLPAADRQDQVTAVVPDDTPAPRTPTGDDARNVECPQCHAAPRHDCRRPRGGSRPVIGYHPERYEAAANVPPSNLQTSPVDQVLEIGDHVRLTRTGSSLCGRTGTITSFDRQGGRVTAVIETEDRTTVEAPFSMVEKIDRAEPEAVNA